MEESLLRFTWAIGLGMGSAVSMRETQERLGRQSTIQTYFPPSFALSVSFGCSSLTISHC